ncbi:hypothetical protein [Microbacterium invictum]|uniref:Uncharacterized protein n=1 Tax=Microbacterium invictum TaxID=515415 RepID=A0ABZ0VBI1_9MICO|nr:hypothetical protein [Microbacterium invictum]WQB70993.1 hypothetical protein T9R20_03250 [Microbacterium invictum]
MTVETSAWRANDAARFDLAREAVGNVVALLLDLSRTGALDTNAALDEAKRFRRDLLDSGFDRARVDQLLTDIESRLAELEGLRQ